MATLDNGITAAISAITQPWIDEHATQIVTDSFAATKLIKQHGRIEMHGGTQSQYPIIDAELGNAAMYDGGVTTTVTPAVEDLMGAMLHQWGHFYSFVFYSPDQFVKNISAKASDEAAINYATVLVKAMTTDIAKLIETQILAGTGAGNQIQGLAKLYDTTNADYYGYDLTGSDGPNSVTIATGFITDLVVGDIIEAYDAVEDEGRFIDTAMVPKTAKRQLRLLADDTIRRPDRGTPNFGFKNIELFESANVVLSVRMPTNRIWMFNWGNEVDTDNSDLSEKFFVLTFADGEPGFQRTDWAPWPDFPAVRYMFSWGAFNLICTNPKRQSQIKWT